MSVVLGRGWANEGRNFLRALSAGVIFGTPLLFTMEMWWHGMVFEPALLLGALGLALLLNTALSKYLGFRDGHSWPEALSESISSVAIACLISIVILSLIGEIDLQTSPHQAIGKVIMQAVVISLGIAVTNAKFGGGQAKSNIGLVQKLIGDPEQLQFRQDLKDLGATLAGAILFSFNIAPTEEITLIATRLHAPQLLGLLGAELLFCYLILFASGFWQRPIFTQDSIFQSQFAETFLATAPSLGVAAVLVVLFGHQHTQMGGVTAVANTVVLGFPAVVGGAAGKLVL